MWFVHTKIKRVWRNPLLFGGSEYLPSTPPPFFKKDIMHIRAKDRVEVDGRTVFFVPKDNITQEQLTGLREGEKCTLSARNENNGWHQRNLDRSIMIATEIRESAGGYNIFVELDYESLPVSRRELDGLKY